MADDYAELADLHITVTKSLVAKDYSAAKAAIDEIQRLTGTTATGLVPLTKEELLEDVPPVRWLCEALDLSPGRPAKIVGVGGGGKSIALQSMALSVIGNELVWGVFPTGSGDVVHLDYEMGRGPTIRRYKRLAYSMRLPWSYVAEHLRLYPFPKMYMNTAGFRDALARAVEGCSFAFIDSLRRALPGEDENGSELTRFIDDITQVSSASGCTFVIAHHASPKAQSTDMRGFGRGSSAIHDACGSELAFSGKIGEPIKVQHTRAFESGVRLQDFRLSIVDEEGELGPKTGLKVVYTGGYVPPEREAAADDEGLPDRIVMRLQRTGPGSRASLARDLKARKTAVVEACEHLIKCGIISEVGTGALTLLTFNEG